MPDWQPNWNDVVFDHPAAVAAADACDGAAAALRAAVADRRHLITTATAAWLGRAKDEFLVEANALADEATALEQSTRALAARIRAAAAAARAEQAAREAARAEWTVEAVADGTIASPGSAAVPDRSVTVVPMAR